MERRLGRGLGSLLGQSAVVEEQKGSIELPIEALRPNPQQPRKSFSPEAMRELVESVRRHGILQPVIVRRSSQGYELISGERRWRAAREVGLSRIPATVRDGVQDEEMLELALVENVQREDLDAIERARGYRAMMDTLHITQEQVAEKVGLQRATVANHLRLLDLPEQVQAAVSKGLISMGHARALLALEGHKQRLEAMERIAREGLSVRQAEALARPQPDPRSKAPQATLVPHQAWIGELERRLRDSLGTRVTLRNRRGYKGQIVVDYFNRADLERLTERLAPRVELD